MSFEKSSSVFPAAEPPTAVAQPFPVGCSMGDTSFPRDGNSSCNDFFGSTGGESLCSTVCLKVQPRIPQPLPNLQMRSSAILLGLEPEAPPPALPQMLQCFP